jgi:hypothetical protein
MDCHGWGFSLVGVVTPHGRPRRYDQAESWRQFSAATVPLARFDRHVWSPGETLAIDLDAVHFARQAQQHAQARWRLVGARGERSAGVLGTFPLQLGGVRRLGSFVITCNQEMLGALHLEVVLLGDDGSIIASNAWPLWVVPANIAPPPQVEVVEAWTPVVAERVAAGARVLVTPDPATLPVEHAVVASFAPMFWSSLWTLGQNPRTHGLLVQPDHPLLRDFPTGTWSDWLWHDVVTGARGLVLDDQPEAALPVEIIDDCTRAHRLGLVVPCTLDSGRAIFCACDLRGDLAARPAARHLKACLLAALAATEPWMGCGRVPLAFRG